MQNLQERAKSIPFSESEGKEIDQQDVQRDNSLYSQVEAHLLAARTPDQVDNQLTFYMQRRSGRAETLVDAGKRWRAWDVKYREYSMEGDYDQMMIRKVYNREMTYAQYFASEAKLLENELEMSSGNTDEKEALVKKIADYKKVAGFCATLESEKKL